MGQSVSTQEKHNMVQDIYAMYPGLEQQLEMAFTCHDLENSGKLPYTTLEPVVRHLLMQYGLIEYVTRFSKESGELDAKHIRTELNEFGVQTRRLCGDCELNGTEFKNLAVVWLRKILDTHADDQAEWMAKLRADQEQQCESYTRAMKEFQEQYSKQQAVYQHGLEEQQRQIQDWNRLLEDAQKTQQQLYEEEVERIKQIQEREAHMADRAAREEREMDEKYMQQLKEIAKADSSGKCFVYPASLTPYGACASAGAQEPSRRRRQVRSDRPVAKGCC